MPQLQVVIPTFTPLCPHCEAALDKVAMVQAPGSSDRVTMFACLSCHHLLGIGFQPPAKLRGRIVPLAPA